MEEYKLWLKKANDDINWTKHNLETKEYSGACFSAQQAAEKALKGFLLYHNKPLRKVHDTVALLEDCLTIDGGFERLRKDAELLFPYYVETRYPFDDEQSFFNRQKAEEAFKTAQEIVNFVEKKLN